MKRFFLIFTTGLLSLCALLSVFAQPAYAQANDPYGLNATAKRTPFAQSVTSGRQLPELIGDIISVALSLIGIIFLVLALYGGFLWMTAQGEADQVKKGRDTIVDATIGVILIVAAYAITNFIFTDVIAPLTGGGGGAPDPAPQAQAQNAPPSNSVPNSDPPPDPGGGGGGNPPPSPDNKYCCVIKDKIPVLVNETNGFNAAEEVCKSTYNQELISTAYAKDKSCSYLSKPFPPPSPTGEYCCVFDNKATLVKNTSFNAAETQCKLVAGLKSTGYAVGGACDHYVKSYCCSFVSKPDLMIKATDLDSATSQCGVTSNKVTIAKNNACAVAVPEKYCCVFKNTSQELVDPTITQLVNAYSFEHADQQCKANKEYIKTTMAKDGNCSYLTQ